jgi:hypothetical protein
MSISNANTSNPPPPNCLLLNFGKQLIIPVFHPGFNRVSLRTLSKFFYMNLFDGLSIDGPKSARKILKPWEAERK